MRKRIAPKLMKSTILALCGTLLLFTSGTASAQRMTSPLTSGWKFIKADVPLTASTGDWEEISIPHTWNAMDGQLGKKGNPEVKGGYYRGIGWYERSLDIRPTGRTSEYSSASKPPR